MDITVQGISVAVTVSAFTPEDDIFEFEEWQKKTTQINNKEGNS